MQTFLPYPDFAESARILDYRRLNKQRSETKQILRALENGGGWANHPAVRMWRGHEAALAAYGIAICEEWRSRDYKDSLLPFFEERLIEPAPMPSWFGDPAFHAAHRSNLLRKKPEHYVQFGWSEPPTLPYIWPR